MKFKCYEVLRPWLLMAVLMGGTALSTQGMEAQVDESGVTHYVMHNHRHSRKSGVSQLATVNGKQLQAARSAAKPVSTRIGTLEPSNAVRFVSSTEPELRAMDSARGVAVGGVPATAASARQVASLSGTEGAHFRGPSWVGTDIVMPHLSTIWPNSGNLSQGAQARAVDYWPLMVKAATQFNLDPLLIRSVIQAESAFNPLALSPKGAMGLMQLMPATARRMGVADGTLGSTTNGVFNGANNGTEEWRVASVPALLQQPEVNIQAGSKYLAYLMQLFEGNTVLAVAAYNAGEGAVQRAGKRIPPYPETQAYVRKVLALYAKAKEQSGQSVPDWGGAPPDLGSSGPT